MLKLWEGGHVQDQWISHVMKKVFQLSDLSMIRMINRLFGKEYADDESVVRYWNDEKIICIRMTIGCADQYTFYIRYLNGTPQIYIREDGCLFYYQNAENQRALKMYSFQENFFGANRKEEYVMALDLTEQEHVTLTIRIYTLLDCSPRKLEEEGLVLFLPLLFCCFYEWNENPMVKREVLKYIIFHDIVGTLHDSMKKGDLTVYDVQKLKQLCGYMAWKMLLGVKWMQSLELQELLMEAFCTDIELLERVHQRELDDVRNK